MEARGRNFCNYARMLLGPAIGYEGQAHLMTISGAKASRSPIHYQPCTAHSSHIAPTFCSAVAHLEYLESNRWTHRHLTHPTPF